MKSEMIIDCVDPNTGSMKGRFVPQKQEEVQSQDSASNLFAELGIEMV